jgi:predicted ATPase with chaperone activity
MTDMNFSPRAYDRALSAYRTITDLAGTEAITSDLVCETVQYRSLDRQLWAVIWKQSNRKKYSTA